MFTVVILVVGFGLGVALMRWQRPSQRHLPQEPVAATVSSGLACVAAVVLLTVGFAAFFLWYLGSH